MFHLNTRLVYQERILIKIKSVFLFQDTLARCCRFRGIKGHGARRSYSVLSRSAQRGSLGASNAGQESTDYSGNSVREEVLPSGPGSGGSSVKDFSGTRRCFRKQDSSFLTDSRGQDSNWVTSPNGRINADPNHRRSFSVVISAAQVSQKPILTKPLRKSNLKIKRKEKRDGKNEKKKSSWDVLRSITSSTNFVEENKKLSASYSMRSPTPTQYSVPPEMFDMLAVCASGSVQSLASSSNNVSNSSLRDVEHGALEDELSAYMRELRRREEC